MDSVAFIFSGQGAQKPGMGQSLYNTSSAVKDMFDAAETIRPGTLRQCFEGPAELLRQTDITQPCLYLTDLAAALALRERGILPAAAAGFSLGEIPALAFCGAFSLAEGFRLACERGRLMRESADRYSASMAAVIKLDNETVESLCKAYPHIYPVNYNAPGQLVVSGYADELKAFDADVREAGGRLLPLAVGGPFHSPLMDSASHAFAQVLEDCEIRLPDIPVYANANAHPYVGDPKVLMSRQINSPVRWEETIRRMAQNGIRIFIETGVGNVLCKLVQKILPDALAYTVFDSESLDKVCRELGVSS